MVKKKTNNTLNFKNISSKYEEEKTKNLHFSLDLNNIDNNNFKEEALIIYEAINEGKIHLNAEEKKEILQELELILNHFETSTINDKSLNHSISDNSNENINSDVKYNENFKIQDFSYSQNTLNYVDDDKYVEDILDKTFPDVSVGDEMGDVLSNLSKNVSSEKNLIIDDCSNGDVAKELLSNNVDDMPSVDDALNDLIDMDFEETLNDKNSSEDFVSIEKSSNESFVEKRGSDDLSVDDALNDLIEDYSNEIAIKFENVSLEFKVSKDKIDTLKEYFIRTVKRNRSGSKIVSVLNDISFEIPKGDRVGIIGFNGAGKSTLLKVLAGVYDATEGTIETKGKIAPLLELGAGFDFNYTGKDNIFLNGAFLGYSEDFLKEKYDEILEFSELGDAINYHVKTYSSGMRAKLGFSIATIVEPDILILDEILSVGDIKFRKKSADKIRSLINSGITVLLVSHSVGQIRDLCNKAIWIDEGKLKMYGEVNEVCDAYVKAASNATKDQLENIQLN